jgi:hypothetical protein
MRSLNKGRIKIMTKVILSEDCGNSPKNIFLKDLSIAIAKEDKKFILRRL